MALTSFDTEQYNALTNADGTSAGVKVGSAYIDIQSGEAPTVNVDPLTNIRYRVRLVPDPADPENTGKGALPDPSRMRWVNADNTGANTNGATVISDGNRQVDTQFFTLEKLNVDDDTFVAFIPCIVTATLAGGALPAYVDLEFNPVPDGSSANELDRSSAFYYQATLNPSLPYKQYSDSSESSE